MLLPAPDEVRGEFSRLMAKNPEDAVRFLHDLGLASGYLRGDTLSQCIRWTESSPYGELECSINLLKPEKNPLDIAAMPVNVLGSAPQCDLCWENEEYPGSPDHPAKPGLRIAKIKLGGECWGLQYSPYAYFNEHCIALSWEHRPMKIDAASIERLLDFADQFPFYFVGANADLPIVGGSILSHDHFQGGRYEFPLMKAQVERPVCLGSGTTVRCGVVRWPASVLRLTSNDRIALLHAAARILTIWRTHTDESCSIVAFDGTEHNTLNPILRKCGTTYSLDLVLRNNCSDAQHPWGIFHPGETLHHIKKENIGLIEIMGMAILPPRLAEELPLLQRELIRASRAKIGQEELQASLLARVQTAPHAAWAADIFARRADELLEQQGRGDTAADELLGQQDRGDTAADEPIKQAGCGGVVAGSSDKQKINLHPVIKQEIARVFVTILETTGVFKRDTAGAAGWDSFIKKLECDW